MQVKSTLSPVAMGVPGISISTEGVVIPSSHLRSCAVPVGQTMAKSVPTIVGLSGAF